MDTVITYFWIFGISLLVYIVFRLAYGAELRITFRSQRRYTVKEYISAARNFKCGPFIFDGKSIETNQLSNRIQHVREELTHGKTPQRPASFKRALAVESKRAEIAKLAFFQSQSPAQSIPQEPEDGLHILMV